MSYNAGQPPTPYSESTAIEVRRKEGTVISNVAIGTITAGNLVKNTNSGVIQTAGTEDVQSVLGVAFYTATSGNRVVIGRGQVRSYWDGAGTVTAGSLIQTSQTQSGWFTGILSGPSYSLGTFAPQPGTGTLGASNSGTLQVILLQ